MNPQLEDIDRQFQTISTRARELAARAGARFGKRPSPGRWSAAECIEHLTISSEAFFPILEEALAEARRKGLVAEAPFRLDFIGKLLIWTLEPPSKFRVPAPAGFHPGENVDVSLVVSRFLASQARVHEFVRAAAGLPVDKIKVRSPFDRRVRYSIWSAFCSAASHQRRHLWQAEQAIRQI
ncbi:MAG: DinB family protein [Bryobacteraceae bacterium]